MRKFTVASFLMMFALTFITTLTFAEDPDWTPVGAIPRDSAHQVTITEDLTGYTTPSDAGPYALGWVGNEKSSYCNTDRDFDFYNWVSVTQWMKIVATGIDRLIEIRKPGTYTLTDHPMKVRIASNGDVLVTFQEIWGDGSWNAKWYEFPGKTYPQLANELAGQIPVDKQYQMTYYGTVEGTPPTGWTEIPAGGSVKFLNDTGLHELVTPVNGFDLQFKEIVAPCNTTGDYVLRGRIVFQCFNQMWYIVPTTGVFDMGRNPSAVPPAPYVLNPM